MTKTEDCLEEVTEFLVKEVRRITNLKPKVNGKISSIFSDHETFSVQAMHEEGYGVYFSLDEYHRMSGRTIRFRPWIIVLSENLIEVPYDQHYPDNLPARLMTEGGFYSSKALCYDMDYWNDNVKKLLSETITFAWGIAKPYHDFMNKIKDLKSFF